MFYCAGSNLQWNLGECSGDDRNYGKSFASIIVIISWMDGETAYNARNMSYITRNSVIWDIYYTYICIWYESALCGNTLYGALLYNMAENECSRKTYCTYFANVFWFRRNKIYDYNERNVSIYISKSIYHYIQKYIQLYPNTRKKLIWIKICSIT